MELVLIRHPAPLLAPGLCYGSTDLDLPPEACAEVLRSVRPALAACDAATPIFSSPLRRAHMLAQVLAAERGQHLHIEADLREMDFGAWEMQSWQAIARAEIDAWANDVLHFRPGDGESVLQMSARVLACLPRLAAAGSEQVIVVCHAGVMRVLLAWQAQADLAQIALRAVQMEQKIAYGQIVHVHLPL